jgi:hypothetical protein
VNFCCRPGRTSQAFQVIILALALLAVEVSDYANTILSFVCISTRIWSLIHFSTPATRS